MNPARLHAIGKEFVRASDPRVRAVAASLAAAVTLVLYDQFNAVFGGPGGDAGFWPKFIVSVGVSNFIFIGALWLVNRGAELFSGRTRLRGTWHHVLSFDVPATDKKGRKKGRRIVKLRHGPVEVKSDGMGELQFIGLNLDPKRDDAYHSNWRSLVVSLDETHVTLLFESRTPYRSPKLGVMVLDLFVSGGGKDVLVGYFSDADRDGRHGEIRLYKDATEWSAEVTRLLAATADVTPAENI